MAEQKLEVIIKWENDNFFEVKAKKDDGDTFTITRNEENTHLLDIWTGIERACIQYIKAVLKEIKADMSE